MNSVFPGALGEQYDFQTARTDLCTFTSIIGLLWSLFVK